MNTKNNLLTSEERFRLMATVSPAMIWMTDADGKCNYVNKTWLDFTGLTLEQAFNENEWAKLIHPDDKKVFSAYYLNLHADNVITVEYRLRHADGNWRWVLDRAVSLFNDNHIFCGYMGSAIDITERKQADIANQYFAAIVQSSDDAIMSKDMNSIVTGWNPAAELIFGYTAEEMAGSPMLKLFPPDRVDEEKFIMGKILNGESIKHFESIRVRKDGELIDVSVSISPIRDATGKVIGASKIARDITEAKKKEKELQHSELTVRAIVETAVTGIITIDSKGTILSANPAAVRLFRYAAIEELLGFNIKMLMPEPYHSEHDGYLLRYLTEGTPRIIGGVVGREVRCLRKDGSTFPASLAVSEIALDGEPQFVGILTDITEQRMNEEILIRYTNELEELVAIQTAEVRAIVQTAINGIVTITADGLIDEFNPAAEFMFGYTKDEVKGKNVNILMPEPYHSQHDGYLNNFLTTGIKKLLVLGEKSLHNEKTVASSPCI